MTTCKLSRSKKKRKKTCVRWSQLKQLSKLQRLNNVVKSKSKKLKKNLKPKRLKLKLLLHRLLARKPKRRHARKLKKKRKSRRKKLVQNCYRTLKMNRNVEMLKLKHFKMKRIA